MPFIIPAATLTGILRWDWVDPDGNVHDLTQATSPNLFVSRGTGGLGSPGVELVLEKLPTSAGSLLRYAKTKPLEITLPISLAATTFSGLLTAAETLRGWFDTGNERERTPGYLRITRPQDDAVRQIACYYTGGLDGDLNDGSPTWTPLVVSLTAPDPYWTDVEETTETYATADVGDDLSVINVGDFDAYPVWTITGPASAITLTNTTTGKRLALTAGTGLSVLSGELLTIDTRPASQRTALPITDADGLSYFDRLTAGSALWWLVPGQNHFEIEASGTDGTTEIELSWLPRYRGVLR